MDDGNIIWIESNFDWRELILAFAEGDLVWVEGDFVSIQ